MGAKFVPLQLKRTDFISARVFSSNSESVYLRALKLQRPSTVRYQQSLYNFVSLIGEIDYHIKPCSSATAQFGVYAFLNVRRAPHRDLVRILLKFRREMAQLSVQHLKLHDLVYVSGHLGSYLKLSEDGSFVRNYEVPPFESLTNKM
ncbi:hypothetical protein SASPL_135580 [Salvia splendens]|uniref:Uncharacterized protein n=1 Tax=Salvia splendens TaxID=180675 RepID=A0A8X8ZFL7_SALSN|nr:hypothetical protein SASPL_135580 [Salvia splendens]